MGKPTCKVPICDRQSATRGWCKPHYERWRKHGDPGSDAIRKKNSRREPCGVDGCETLSSGSGYCPRHYQAFKKYGDPLGKSNRVLMRDTPCEVPECGRPALAKNLCSMHYQRMRTHGSPNAVGLYGPAPKYVRKPNPTLCSVKGCELPHNSHGYCTTHLYRADRGYPLEEQRRVRAYSADVLCEMPGCSGQVVAKWLCYRHWSFYRKYGNPGHRKAGEVRDGKRVCPQCGQDIPVEEFSGSYCASCSREYARNRAFLASLLVNQRTCKICGHLYHSANSTKVTCSKVCAYTNERNTRASVASRRRARLSGRTIEKFTHLEIFERDGWQCGICGEDVDPELQFPDPRSATLDHIVPIFYGGGHTRDNVQLAHFFCNTSKGTRRM